MQIFHAYFIVIGHTEDSLANVYNLHVSVGQTENNIYDLRHSCSLHVFVCLCVTVHCAPEYLGEDMKMLHLCP